MLQYSWLLSPIKEWKMLDPRYVRDTAQTGSTLEWSLQGRAQGYGSSSKCSVESTHIGRAASPHGTHIPSNRKETNLRWCDNWT